METEWLVPGAKPTVNEISYRSLGRPTRQAGALLPPADSPAPAITRAILVQRLALTVALEATSQETALIEQCQAKRAEDRRVLVPARTVPLPPIRAFFERHRTFR
jgi:hypothetical protein